MEIANGIERFFNKEQSLCFIEQPILQVFTLMILGVSGEFVLTLIE